MELKLTPSQQAALATDKHIILTANAGSGKTATLTRRMLEIMLAMEPFDIHSIVAITFTELAASELFHKVQKTIDEEINGETDIPRLKRLFEIKSSLLNANISTIHSFCLNLLKEFPLETKLDAQVQIIDTFTKDEFITSSIRHVINSWFEDEAKKNDIKYIFRLFLNKATLISALKKCIENRYLFTSVPFRLITGEDRTAFEKLYADYTAGMLGSLITKREYDEIVAYLVAVNKYADIPAYNNLSEFVMYLRERKGAIFTKDLIFQRLNQHSKKHGLNAEILTEVSKKISSIIENEEGKGTEELFQFNCIFFSMVKDVLAEYERKKRVRSFLDFEDMQIYTRELIAMEEVRSILANRFKYILVDEYQDTNDLQYEIILPLLEQLKKNNLFVVGDDKQSIYGFRGADLAVFEKTREDIKKINEEGNLTLAESFRMTPQLCGFVNRLFRSVFGENPEKKFNEIAYKETIAGLPVPEISGSPARISDTKIEVITTGSEEEQANSLVSRLIALYKEYFPTGQFRFSDIAVLVSKNDDMAPLRKALTAGNVPFTIIGGKGFFRAQIVLDMLNYLEFLAFPESDNALTGLLKSPFFNYSDQDMLLLFEDRDDNIFGKLKKLATVNERESRTVQVLADMQQFALNSKPFDILLKITEDNNLLSVMAARSNGDQIIADYNKLVDMSFVYSSTGIRNLPEFVRYLKNAYTEDKDESNADISAGREAVRVMTIHKSKGLQFKAVFLFNSGTEFKQNKDDFAISKELGFLKKLRPTEQLEDPDFSFIHNLYKSIENRKALAEHYRKFYVAVTRAANFLFFFEQKSREASFSYFVKRAFGETITDEIRESVEIYNPVTEPKNYRETVTIPLVYFTEVPEDKLPELQDEKIPQNLLYDTTPLQAESTTESFSASQFASFVFCPVQFFLQYRITAGVLKNEQKLRIMQDEDYEKAETTEENEEPSSAAVNYASAFGTFIHDLLSDERYLTINEEQMGNRVSVFLPVEKMTSEEQSMFVGRAMEYIKHVCGAGYNTWKNIVNKQNEAQLITLFGNAMFEGRLDLLIETDDTIIIADYKTNLLSLSTLDEKINLYRPQMDYYAWLVNKVRNPLGKKIKTCLHFLHINREVFFEYDAEKIAETEKTIVSMLKGTRNNSYEKITNNCPHCRYSTDGIHCVVPGTLHKD